MRYEALNFLMCPDCGGELLLDGAVAPEAVGHVLSRKLICLGCVSNAVAKYRDELEHDIL
jgi:hypothetical protein